MILHTVIILFSYKQKSTTFKKMCVEVYLWSAQVPQSSQAGAQ